MFGKLNQKRLEWFMLWKNLKKQSIIYRLLRILAKKSVKSVMNEK